MATDLDRIVPFGRTFDEYRSFFKLSSKNMEDSILGVGDGPASFNAELSEKGGKAISIDPLYIYGSGEIRRRFNEVIDGIIEQVKATPNDWTWSYHKSPEALRQKREEAMRLFENDYERGKAEGRYLACELPSLPFPDGSFDLALCSHLLFLYSEQMSCELHIASAREMLRVAKELRIFPLKTLMLEDSPHVKPVMDALSRDGFKVALERVPYEFQRGGHTMLRAWRA